MFHSFLRQFEKKCSLSFGLLDGENSIKKCLTWRYRVLSFFETKFYIQATALSYDGGVEGPPGVAWS